MNINQQLMEKFFASILFVFLFVNPSISLSKEPEGEYIIKLKSSNTLLKVKTSDLKYINKYEVEYLEYNHKLKKLDIIPNDPLYPEQYALKMLGFENIWKYCKESPNIVVAVIDSGIDTNHKDLKDNIWKNPNEICNNGKDDDENGFVDDCYGWNFVTNSNNVYDDDPDKHGTMLSGIIGAITNNKEGISGVSWNIKIMALKILDSAGNGDIYSLYMAIKYAVDNGAKIINLSLGYPVGCFYVEQSSILKEIIEYADKKGVLVVSSAGNYGCNNDLYPFYPASFENKNIISVGSSSKINQLSWFSNYGFQTVHLLSYGEGILSTTGNDKYKSASGTSFASPFVAGLAALIMSCQDNLTHIQVKEKIVSSAKQFESLKNLTISGGILDAYSAYISQVKPIRPTGLSGYFDTNYNSVILKWKDNSALETGYRVERSLDSLKWDIISTLPANSNYFNDYNVQSGRTYYYRVYAVTDNLLSDYSNFVSISVYPPSNNVGGGSGCTLSAGSQVVYYLLGLAFILILRKIRTYRNKSNNTAIL